MRSRSHPEVLPEELQIEILSWLPVKDLMRFRCVSKWWNSVVFDPVFVQLHLQKSSKNSHVLLFVVKEWVGPCSIDGLLENPSSTIDGCHRFDLDFVMRVSVCNGLVCASFSYVEDEENSSDCVYYFKFWNPATRMESPDLAHIRLDYTLSTSFAFGFGYDDSTDTYKLLAVIVDFKSKTMQVRVYSLGTNTNSCWTTILTCPASFYISEADNGCFLSHTVNWLAVRKFCYEWENISINEVVIVSYDLRKDTFRYLSMPHDLVEKPVDKPTLEVLNGCLCLYHRGRTHFTVWLMREFGVDNSWTQLLKVSYEHLQFPSIFSSPPAPVILCMSEGEDVMLLADTNGGRITLYNKRDNATDVFIYQYETFFSFDYVQSLTWPAHMQVV